MFLLDSTKKTMYFLGKEREKEDPFSKDLSSWTGLESSGQDNLVFCCNFACLVLEPMFLDFHMILHVSVWRKHVKHTSCIASKFPGNKSPKSINNDSTYDSFVGASLLSHLWSRLLLEEFQIGLRKLGLDSDKQDIDLDVIVKHLDKDRRAAQTSRKPDKD